MDTESSRSAKKPSDLKRKSISPAPGKESREALPATIGKYKVLERLGSGAMGVVYKCSQPGLDRPVAIKMLLAAKHANSGQVLRFQREARAASRLTHPNVVQIYDVGVDGNCHYLVMEYVDASSLDQLINTPALSAAKSLKLLLQVASALQAAHEHGIIHRDIKPSNILITKAGQPKLADFGLAKSLHDSQSLSGSCDIIGTPRYMSPEQVVAAPDEVDARSDIYSLGAVMYEMLTGRPPLTGSNVLEILRKLSDEEPVPIRQLNSAVPEEVAAICRRAMAKQPQDRYGSAAQMAQAIHSYLLGQLRIKSDPGRKTDPDLPLAIPVGKQPTRPRRWLAFVVAATALAVAITLAAYFGWAGSKAKPKKAVEDPAAESLAQAREQLNDSLVLRGNITPREQLQSLVDDLSAVLKRAPDHLETRFLRGRAWRWSGEYLASVNDLSHLLHRHPDHLPAVQERLLANYQLHVLYLGNINEMVLRPRRRELVRADVQKLQDRGDAAQKSVAQLVDALAQHDYPAAAGLADKGVPEGMRSQADWLMLQADAAAHAAVAAYAAELSAADDNAREAAQQRREQLVRRATQALRRGLEADPHHVGLLFLKANSLQRWAWEMAENEDRPTFLRRQGPAFEALFDRLRRVTLRRDCDTSIARAVLLSNFGQDLMALHELKDALGFRPSSFLHLDVYQAWLRLLNPPGGVPSLEDLEAILRSLQPVFESPPDDFQPYFVRALLQAASGRWEQARPDLRQCQRKLGQEALPTFVPTYAAWLGTTDASTSKYLESTLDLLAETPTPADVRLRLTEELLRRLSDAALVQQDALQPEEAQSMKGWTHLRLARLYTDKQDRAQVLQHAREALQLKLADLAPKTLREDGTLSAWNEDPDFVTLYAEFNKQ